MSLGGAAFSLPAAGLSYDSTDPADGPLLLGDEMFAFQFDADDRGSRGPGSVVDAAGGASWLAPVGGPATFIASDAGFGDAVVGKSERAFHLQDRVSLGAMDDGYTFTIWVDHSEPFGVFEYIFLTLGGQSGHGFSALTINGIVRAIVPTTTGYVFTSFGTPLPTGGWTHLAFVGDGATLTLYVDGVATSTISKAPVAPWRGGLAAASLGSHMSPTFDHEYFRGRYDEARLYDRPLSGGEIWRIASTPYRHANVPPVADAGQDLAPVCDAATGLAEAALDGSGSYDPEGDAITYAWSAPTAATLADSAAATATATFTYGTHWVDLTVDDSEDTASDTAAVAVVDDSAPDIDAVAWNLGTPLEGQRVTIGATEFAVAASDLCSGLEHVELVASDGTVVTDDEAPFALTYDPALGAGLVTLEIRAQDQAGNVATAGLGEFVVVGTRLP